MLRFIQRHAQKITGVLSGFDRLRFLGTLRELAHSPNPTPINVITMNGLVAVVCCSES